MPRRIPEGGSRLSPERKPPDKWDQEAQRVIRLEMLRADVDVGELAKRLKKLGSAPPTEKALALRLARGTFSFGFALKVLRALDLESLDISHVKKHTRG
jgi:hypothetical protein